MTTNSHSSMARTGPLRFVNFRFGTRGPSAPNRFESPRQPTGPAPGDDAPRDWLPAPTGHASPRFRSRFLFKMSLL